MAVSLSEMEIPSRAINPSGAEPHTLPGGRVDSSAISSSPNGVLHEDFADSLSGGHQEFNMAFEGKHFHDVRQFVASIILDHIHPVTGLLPAATRDRFVAGGHYDHAWIRDTELAQLHLLNSTRYGLDPELDREIQRRVGDAVGKTLDLLANEPWRSAFAQHVEYNAKKNHTYLTAEPPPIHMQTDGSSCFWWTQNQPDSWGDMLNVAGTSAELGVLSPTGERTETITNIVSYLLKIQPEIFKASTMWEDGEVYSPSSLSNAMAIRAGLGKILPFIQEDGRFAERIRRGMTSLDRFIDEQFPIDYTVPNGHHSKTDLATLVAMGADNHAHTYPISHFFIRSRPELGNGATPGLKRFVGDRYYNPREHEQDARGTEAVWPMGHMLVSILHLRRAVALQNSGVSIGREYAAKGLAKLQRVLTDAETYGYFPELFMPEEVVYSTEGTTMRFVPNNNNLLWNLALVAENTALAEQVSLQAAA